MEEDGMTKLGFALLWAAAAAAALFLIGLPISLRRSSSPARWWSRR